MYNLIHRSASKSAISFLVNALRYLPIALILKKKVRIPVPGNAFFPLHTVLLPSVFDEMDQEVIEFFFFAQ